MSININKNRYKDMVYNYAGKSGLKLPIISLGLWYNFGEIDCYENSKNLILHSFDNGITHFDIANNYGPPPGAAEVTMGKILKNELKGYRDELIISTKAGYCMWEGPYGDFGSKKHITASIDKSLKRLGLDYVDIFYHHRPDFNTPIEETVEALELIVRQGKALYIGVSNYDLNELNSITNELKNRKIKLLISQPKYSLLDRTIENGIHKFLIENGIGTITFQPLAQGLLTNKYLNDIPNDSRASNKAALYINKDSISENLINMVTGLNEIAINRGQSLAQMAISWVLKNKDINSVLIGASKISQIDENLLAIANISFSDNELKMIDRILYKYNKNNEDS